MDNNIEVPVNKSASSTVKLAWKLPALTYIPSVLHNPIYAGAYVYGRRPVEKILEDGKICRRQQSIQSHDKAKVFIQDHHEGYISWKTYEKNQQMIEHNGTNFQKDPQVLAAREGHGLLSGLLRCSRCGKKLHVRYWGKSGTHARYLCMGDYNSAGSYCIGFAGKGSDDAVSQEILNCISVEGINASIAAVEKCNNHEDDRQQALQRQLEQLNYEAQRAFSRNVETHVLWTWSEGLGFADRPTQW